MRAAVTPTLGVEESTGRVAETEETRTCSPCGEETRKYTAPDGVVVGAD